MLKWPLPRFEPDNSETVRILLYRPYCTEGVMFLYCNFVIVIVLAKSFEIVVKDMVLEWVSNHMACTT